MFRLGKASSDAEPEFLPAVARDEGRTSMSPSDKALALFDQLRGLVYRYLIRKTQDAARAEDLTQETFLRLCRHLTDDKPLDNPKAWLLTVANNLAIDVTRGAAHEKDLDEIAWKEIEESRSGRLPDPEKLLLHQERLDRLHMAVLNLTPLQRQCLHLRAEGLRYREVAELLGLSVSTVVDAVRRATVKLAREFDAETSA